VRELALHLLDVMQNAVEAGATRVALEIREDHRADRLVITVRDNGRGIAPQALDSVTDPFYTTRTTRHVGLGLPLFASAAERAEGRLTVCSQPGAGTSVQATFVLSHPDRQPLGDLAGTLVTFLFASQAPDLHYIHRVDGETFEFDTAELRAQLGDVPLTHPAVQRWLAGFLAEGEGRVGASRWTQEATESA
jgi:nitrogen-specific signal transduction histidine kinase